MRRPTPTRWTPPPAARSEVGRGRRTRTPQGEGWKLSGATKWLQTGYTIKFYDQKSADWPAPYVQASAADLRRITNLPVTVDRLRGAVPGRQYGARARAR
ncbi:hypothetical protein ACGFYQ_30055 [Streptomyces sp. NPDC048258]|uniref:hypothetical protein n=1 Tax=Streptomyces sp. NPDC048258 TaxID=3365527 RepID=UPI00370FE4C8